MNRSVALMLATAAGTFICGAVGGYFAAQNILKAKYEEALEREIEATKNFYAQLNKEGMETPEKAIEVLGTPVPSPVRNVINAYQGRLPTSFPVVEAAQVVNIFTRDEEKGDTVPEDIVRNRTEEAPYVIALGEFDANDNHYEQVTYTYYAGDETLADEDEQIVDDIDMRVGLDNLERFGHYSKDGNVVYVCNDALSLHIQILRSSGKYSEVVAGFTR